MVFENYLKRKDEIETATRKRNEELVKEHQIKQNKMEIDAKRMGTVNRLKSLNRSIRK